MSTYHAKVSADQQQKEIAVNDNDCKCAHPSSKEGGALTLFLSIPWCCVVSLSIAFITTTGSLIGFLFDELMHDVIPFLVAFHIYGIVRYARHPEKTRGRTMFLVATTLLFLVSVGFHFTELHDHILWR